MGLAIAGGERAEICNMRLQLQNANKRSSAIYGCPWSTVTGTFVSRSCKSEPSTASWSHLLGGGPTAAASASDHQRLQDHPQDVVRPDRQADYDVLGNSRKRLGQMGLAALAIWLVSVAIVPPAHASIAQAVATSLREIAPDSVVVFVLASLPIIELRGAVPVGISILGLSPPLAYLLAVMGNMVPVPLILLGLQPLFHASTGLPPLYRLLEGILQRARKQTKQMDESTIFMGLAYFVAVPLPGTGAWSGAIAAYVLDVPFWPAVMSNFIGVCCAGALVTMLTCMGWPGLWLAIIILLVLPLLSFLVKSMKSDRK
eukprot:jgi/Ulvmu1/7552/UM037_0096.1